MDGHRHLNTSVADLSDYLVKKYRVDVPKLDRDGIVADQRETRIDVSRDPRRWIDDRSRPFYITGTEVEITIPFDGDETAFRVQPNTFSLNPPRGRVKRGCLQLSISGTELSADQVRSQIENSMGQIEECWNDFAEAHLHLNVSYPVSLRKLLNLDGKNCLQTRIGFVVGFQN